MTRWPAFLLLASLSACTTQQPSPDQAACERQADEDPAVRAMIAKGAGSEHFLIEKQADLKAARQDATLACLRSRGVVRRGGVERQRP